MSPAKERICTECRKPISKCDAYGRGYSVAQAVLLERLDQIFGHETAHLLWPEQLSLATEASAMFAKIAREILHDE